MRKAIDTVRPGVRQCDAAAAIYHAQISGTPEYGGDYTSFVPMLPTGIGTSTPHLTWSDAPVRDRRGDDPGARRLPPPLPLPAGAHACSSASRRRSSSIPRRSSCEGLNAALAAAKPGATCEEVEAAWRAVIARHGIVKESRIGYSDRAATIRRTGASTRPACGPATRPCCSRT